MEKSITVKVPEQLYVKMKAHKEVDRGEGNWAGHRGEVRRTGGRYDRA
ncbi:MAG: hypothetical protein MPF33_10600 [Candidatus Aramenus sp.]|jgi:hypothetical protein|nr:hypothetical protein [Candidatus Aramenus sp.]